MSRQTDVRTGSFAGTPSWGQAARLSAAWAVAATVVNVIIWVTTAHLLAGSLLFLLAAPLLLIVLAGVVHRSSRVALITALCTLILNALVFLLLVVLALSVVHWRN
jgi:hypothetical protein